MKLTRDQFSELCKQHVHLNDIQAAAKELYDADISLPSISLRRARLKAKGQLPLDSGNSVQSGEVLKGSSTLYDADGNIKLQWVKSDVAKEDSLESFRTAVESITESLVSHYSPVAPPQFNSSELTTFYPLPDLHFGLLIHGSESNHNYNWDLKHATEWVLGAMDSLVESSPSSQFAVITDLGDFLHFSDNSNTTTSGHQLDADGRMSKIINASFDITRALIDKALTKHQFVYFYSVAGNHSEDVSIYLKAFLSAWYKDEPRVIVKTDHVAQQYHVFGKNILGFTHGHELKPAKAGEVLVYDNQEIFSQSEYRYFHFGHLHSNHTTEGTLCTVEVHKNITPRDKWAESMGFRGTIGQAKSITYHSEFGEIARSIFNIKMLNQSEKELDE